MVESAPLFIEYYCVGYMHIDAVKALVLTAFACSLAGALIISAAEYFFFKRKTEK